MREICKRYHVDPVGPTLGYVAICCHTGAHVSMTPHWSKETHLRPIRSQYMDRRAHNHEITGKKHCKHLHNQIGTHLVGTWTKTGTIRATPGSTDPTVRPLALPFHLSACCDEPMAMPGACPNIPAGSCSSFSWKIHQLDPYSSSQRVTTLLVVPMADNGAPPTLLGL
jgi:hypothetical protein